MQTNFQKVVEFHKAFGHPHSDEPNLTCSPDLLELRKTLIAEEYNEAMQELHKASLTLAWKGQITKEELELIAGELADVLVVVYGTASVLGIDLDKAYSLKHNANMSKLDPETGKPILREDGKILKGPNFKPADMSKIWE